MYYGVEYVLWCIMVLSMFYGFEYVLLCSMFYGVEYVLWCIMVLSMFYGVEYVLWCIMVLSIFYGVLWFTHQGLEYVAFSLMEKCTAVSLVSDGAEAILINKKFFLQHLSDEMRKKLRTTVRIC